MADKTRRAQRKKEFTAGFFAGLAVIGGIAAILLGFFFL